MTKINENTIVGETNKTLRNLLPYILYENSSGATGNITFDGNYKDYEYISVSNDLGTGMFHTKKSDINISSVSFSDVLYQEYDVMKFTYNSNTNKTTMTHIYQGAYYLNANHQSNRKTYEIIGWK